MNENHGSAVTLEAPATEHDAAIAEAEAEAVVAAEAEITDRVEAQVAAEVEIAQINADAAVEVAEVMAEAEARTWQQEAAELREMIAENSRLTLSVLSRMETLLEAEAGTQQLIVEEAEAPGGESGEPPPPPPPSSEPASPTPEPETHQREAPRRKLFLV